MKIFFTIALLLISTNLRAATIEDISNIFLSHGGDVDSKATWSIAEKIPDIEWKDSVPRIGGYDRHVRSGKILLYGHGKGDILLIGDQQSVSKITIYISESEGKIFEQDQFTEVVSSQFSKQTKIDLIEKCPIGAITGRATYKVSLIGHKPIYVHVETDSGGTQPKSRGSIFSISPIPQEEWKWGCNP